MWIQPSSRLRPSTFGTSLMLVRYIDAPSLADVIPVVAFTAFASAAPIFSPLFVMIVLQNLVHRAAGTLHGPPQNRCRRCRDRGRGSSSRSPPRRAASGCRGG